MGEPTGRLRPGHNCGASGVAGQRDAWLEALPDTLQGTATAEALQAIVDLDLDMLAAIEPPRGYGRD